MKNISASTSSNKSDSSSPMASSQAQGIALCSVFMLEAVLMVVGNLLIIILFVMKKKIHKKCLFLVTNMAFADVMLGAVTLPLYVYIFVGPTYQLWTAIKSLRHFYSAIDTIFAQSSLISAAFISCERYFAIYWPLKYKALSMRVYYIVILVTWILAIIISTVTILAGLLLTTKHQFSIWISFPLILLLIVCVCNMGIWKKFRQRKIASTSQNQRLTKTLLFVSVIAVMTWLPLLIAIYFMFVHEMDKPHVLLLYNITNILNYSNSLFNPVIYAFRIPEFRESLSLCCLRQAVLSPEGREDRKRTLTMVMELQSESRPQPIEQEVLDSNL